MPPPSNAAGWGLIRAVRVLRTGKTAKIYIADEMSESSLGIFTLWNEPADLPTLDPAELSARTQLLTAALTAYSVKSNVVVYLDTDDEQVVSMLDVVSDEVANTYRD